jgi:uncharacterized membrane protein
MIYLVAILIAAGGALTGWQLGLAVFIAAFEILRWLHLEALLDSAAALTTFRYAHIAAVIATGLWLLRRWRPRSDQATSGGKVVLIATVTGMGSALLAVPLIVVSLRSAQSLTPFLAGLAAALIGGAAITAIAYGRLSSRIAIAVRSGLASILAVAVIWLGFIFDDETWRFAARLGQPRTVLIDIRIPDRTDRPALAAIRIAMRSEGRDFPGQLEIWMPESDGLLRASVPLVVGTRDRTIVLALPNEPERLLPIDLPTNPRPTEDFGPWVRFEPGPAHEARYLIR